MSPLPRQRQDEFEKTTMLPLEGARPRAGYLIRCSSCGASDKVSLHRNGPMPPDFTARRFEAMGWNTDKGRRDRDFCPACAKAKFHPRKESSVKMATTTDDPRTATFAGETAAPRPVLVPDAPLSTAQALEAAPGPPMARGELSRDDRRVVFAKLNEVYIDENTGYSVGWGDRRVANDLGVPVEWVKTVRDANFGPDVSSAEIKELVDQSKACSADVQKYFFALEGIRAGIENLTGQIRKLEAEKPALLMQITRIEGHAARLSSHIEAP